MSKDQRKNKQLPKKRTRQYKKVKVPILNSENFTEWYNAMINNFKAYRYRLSYYVENDIKLKEIKNEKKEWYKKSCKKVQNLLLASTDKEDNDLVREKTNDNIASGWLAIVQKYENNKTERTIRLLEKLLQLKLKPTESNETFLKQLLNYVKTVIKNIDSIDDFAFILLMSKLNTEYPGRYKTIENYLKDNIEKITIDDIEKKIFEFEKSDDEKKVEELFKNYEKAISNESIGAKSVISKKGSLISEGIGAKSVINKKGNEINERRRSSVELSKIFKDPKIKQLLKFRSKEIKTDNKSPKAIKSNFKAINNKSNISSYKPDVSNYKLKMNANKSDINVPKSDIGSYKPDISNYKLDMNANKSDINVNKSNIGSYKSDISSYKTDMNANKSDISSYKTDMNANKSDIGSYKTDMNANKSDINVNKSDINVPKSDINVPKSDIGSYKPDISNYKFDMKANKSDINVPKSDIGSYKSDISSYKTDINGNKSDIGGYKLDLSTYKPEINTNKPSAQLMNIKSDDKLKDKKDYEPDNERKDSKLDDKMNDKKDTKSDENKDSNSDNKSDDKLFNNKSDQKHDSESATKLDPKPDTKSDTKSDAKSDTKSDTKSDSKSDSKSDTKLDNIQLDDTISDDKFVNIKSDKNNPILLIGKNLNDKKSLELIKTLRLPKSEVAVAPEAKSDAELDENLKTISSSNSLKITSYETTKIESKDTLNKPPSTKIVQKKTPMNDSTYDSKSLRLSSSENSADVKLLSNLSLNAEINLKDNRDLKDQQKTDFTSISKYLTKKSNFDVNNQNLNLGINEKEFSKLYLGNGITPPSSLSQSLNSGQSNQSVTGEIVNNLKDVKELKDSISSKDSISLKDVINLNDSISLKDVNNSKDVISLKDAASLKDSTSSKDVINSKDLISLKDTASLKDSTSSKGSTSSKDTINLPDISNLTESTVETFHIFKEIVNKDNIKINKKLAESDNQEQFNLKAKGEIEKKLKQMNTKSPIPPSIPSKDEKNKTVFKFDGLPTNVLKKIFLHLKDTELMTFIKTELRFYDLVNEYLKEIIVVNKHYNSQRPFFQNLFHTNEYVDHRIVLRDSTIFNLKRLGLVDVNKQIRKLITNELSIERIEFFKNLEHLEIILESDDRIHYQSKIKTSLINDQIYMNFKLINLKILSISTFNLKINLNLKVDSLVLSTLKLVNFINLKLTHPEHIVNLYLDSYHKIADKFHNLINFHCKDFRKFRSGLLNKKSSIKTIHLVNAYHNNLGNLFRLKKKFKIKLSVYVQGIKVDGLHQKIIVRDVTTFYAEMRIYLKYTKRLNNLDFLIGLDVNFDIKLLDDDIYTRLFNLIELKIDYHIDDKIKWKKLLRSSKILQKLTINRQIDQSYLDIIPEYVPNCLSLNLYFDNEFDFLFIKRLIFLNIIQMNHQLSPLHIYTIIQFRHRYLFRIVFNYERSLFRINLNRDTNQVKLVYKNKSMILNLDDFERQLYSDSWPVIINRM